MLPMTIFDAMQSVYRDFDLARANQRLQNLVPVPATKLAEKTKWWLLAFTWVAPHALRLGSFGAATFKSSLIDLLSPFKPS